MATVTLLMVTLGACSGPLGFLTGGGPNIAANTQVGKTNSQTVGTTQNLEQRLENVNANRVRQSNDTNRVQADSVETVVVNEIPAWIVISLFLIGLLGWLLPTPQQIGHWFINLFKRDTT